MRPQGGKTAARRITWRSSSASSARSPHRHLLDGSPLVIIRPDDEIDRNARESQSALSGADHDDEGRKQHPHASGPARRAALATRLRRGGADRAVAVRRQQEARARRQLRRLAIQIHRRVITAHVRTRRGCRATIHAGDGRPGYRRALRRRTAPDADVNRRLCRCATLGWRGL
jgi:hypothetical protein